MKTKIIIAASILTIIGLSGCKAEDGLVNLFNAITKESTEAYENVKTEVETKTSAVEDKINKINEAAEDIGEATNAIGEAIDSVQAINGDETQETGTGTDASAEYPPILPSATCSLSAVCVLCLASCSLPPLPHQSLFSQSHLFRSSRSDQIF